MEPQEPGDGVGWYYNPYPPRPDGIMPKAVKGDVVWLQAKVIEVYPGDELGYVVTLFSKQQEYQAIVRPDHVVRVVRAPRIPPEPPFGTYILHMPDEDEDQMTVFAHIGLDKERPWRDVAAQQNITWTEAYLRGARSTAADIIVLGPNRPDGTPKVARPPLLSRPGTINVHAE